MSNESAPVRKPTGVPEGGQFDVNPHAQTSTTLAPVRPPLKEGKRGVFEVVDTLSETLDSGGDRVVTTRIHMGGMPNLKAQAHMAGKRMERSEQPDALRNKLDSLAKKGSKATLLLQGRLGSITAREGTLMVTADGCTALVNKGAKNGAGIYLIGHGANQTLLGICQGYGGAQALANQYQSYADELPELEPATFDEIPEAAEDQEPPSEVAAVYVFDHPGFEPSQDGRGSLFFVTDFQPGDGSDQPYGAGIVNGYGVYSGDSGLQSEHGSMYARDLKRWGGRVKGYQPGSHTFKDAMFFGLVADRNDDIEACWESVKAASS